MNAADALMSARGQHAPGTQFMLCAGSKRGPIVFKRA
jgi:hypothetical protein